MIQFPERRTKAGMVPSLLNPAWTAGREAAVEGLYCAVALDGGMTAEVSKLAGETAWTIDALWTRGGAPVFSNGYGARYLVTRRLPEELAAVLDAASPDGHDNDHAGEPDTAIFDCPRCESAHDARWS